MSEATDMVKRAFERWNAHDREGWAALFDEGIEFEAPGGVRLSGLAAFKESFFDVYMEAVPDNALRDAVVFGEKDLVAEEARFTGTHTGTLRTPAGEVPATGKTVDLPYAAILRVENEKITSFRIYFDQVAVLTQLGLMPETAAAS